MNFKSALLTLAMLALLSAPVLAQDETEEPEGPSTEEIVALKAAIAKFEQADYDKDKTLTKDEFTNGRGMRGKMWETYDVNGDSSLTLDEWKAIELKPK